MLPSVSPRRSVLPHARSSHPGLPAVRTEKRISLCGQSGCIPIAESILQTLMLLQIFIYTDLAGKPFLSGKFYNAFFLTPPGNHTDPHSMISAIITTVKTGMIRPQNSNANIGKRDSKFNPISGQVSVFILPMISVKKNSCFYRMHICLFRCFSCSGRGQHKKRQANAATIHLACRPILLCIAVFLISMILFARTDFCSCCFYVHF